MIVKKMVKNPSTVRTKKIQAVAPESAHPPNPAAATLNGAIIVTVYNWPKCQKNEFHLS